MRRSFLEIKVFNNNMLLILYEMYRFLKLILRYMELEFSGCNIESIWFFSLSFSSLRFKNRF